MIAEAAEIDTRKAVRYSDEDPMLGIALGAASFFVVFWVDVAAMKGMSLVKPVLWLAGIALFAGGALICLAEPVRVALPVSVRAAGWTLAALFALLLAYSLFFEIPLSSAYLRAGQPSAVVSTGTYALCRHPGVLWFAGLLASVFAASGSIGLARAIPVWVGLDILYVLVQDRFFFPRMFGEDYRAYQRSVPMLVPTAHSIRECARTTGRKGN